VKLYSSRRTIRGAAAAVLPGSRRSCPGRAAKTGTFGSLTVRVNARYKQRSVSMKPTGDSFCNGAHRARPGLLAANALPDALFA